MTIVPRLRFVCRCVSMNPKSNTAVNDIAVCELILYSINSQTAMSFTAVFDFGFMETHLQTNLKRGTMVIATANKFSDLSGRSDYYTREFFYQVDDDSF